MLHAFHIILQQQKSAPPIRCFLCIDFVRVTNCFYDYDYDEITVKHVKMRKNANRDITNRNGLVLRLCGAICRIYEKSNCKMKIGLGATTGLQTVNLTVYT